MRGDIGSIKGDYSVKMRVSIAVQGAPVGYGLLPLGAAYKLACSRISARRKGAAFYVFDGFVIYSHQPCARARFNGHIANAHAPFHAQRANGAACKLNSVPCAASSADFADDSQHHIFGSNALLQLAIYADKHVFGFFGQQRLRSHNVLNLARANAVSQSAKSAVGAGVAVAANNRHARQSSAIFRAYDVHNTLALVLKRKIGSRTKLQNIGIQRADLLAAGGVGNGIHTALPALGGCVVVGGGNDGAGTPQGATSLA